MSHFDPQTVERKESLDAWITGNAVIDAPLEPKVVPALSWQAEILFMACLLAVGLWTDNKQRRHSTFRGVKGRSKIGKE